MKSLESLEIINICLKELADEHKEDTNIWRYDLETIKQDLEVLDIIRKKKVDVEHLTYALESYDSLEDVLNCYNTSIDYHLTMEELLKLKQWVEGNE